MRPGQFVYLPEQQARQWKDRLERYVRQACDELRIHRRGVHGFRGTAAGEFISVKRVLGFTDVEARHELAMWLGHNPHRTEVTYAYTCPAWRATAALRRVWRGGQCQGVPKRPTMTGVAG